MVYAHLHLVDFYGKCIGRYTVRPMDPLWESSVFFGWLDSAFLLSQVTSTEAGVPFQNLLLLYGIMFTPTLG